MSHYQQTSLATQCLWSLQESSLLIEGLVLCLSDGLVMTSTFIGDEATQRLGAVATAMMLLSERATLLWGRGELAEVVLKLKDDDEHYRVHLHPVGGSAVLISVLKDQRFSLELHNNLQRATEYIEAVLLGESPEWPHWDQSVS